MSEHSNRANLKPPSVDRLSLLWRRINDHKMVQWSVAYVALAYGIQHGIVLTREAFDWPHAIEQISMLLLALGLPVTVTFAWYHGERASRRISGPELTIIAILLAIGSLFFYVLVRPSEEVTTRTSGVQQAAGVAAARSAAADPHGAISVAVLPFANLSSDKEQEFFSDGMTEDIITALAKIPDLRVVARESASQYKGERNDMRAVGQALNATHLIEGSVRKVGTRVRITAQLVKAEDGVNIWADSYDREMTDVFAIQEDIARAIATSLRMPLGIKPGENLVANRNIDPELYQQFLRLRAQLRALNNQATREKALPELEKLVARDPNFAPAWAYLSRVYIFIQNPLYFTILARPAEETRRLLQPAYEKAEKAAREAIRLDPRQAFAYANLAMIEVNRKNWASAETLMRQALEFDPNDPDVLLTDGYFLLQTGRVKDSIRVLQQAQALEPLTPGYTSQLAIALMADHQGDAALAMLETMRLRQGSQYAVLAQAYAMAGRFDKAADEILLVRHDLFGGPGEPVREAARLIRTAPAKLGDPTALPALHGWLDFVYAYVGAPERLLDYPERAMQAGDQAAVPWFAATYAPVRKTERFKKLVRDAGLVDYWKARGWPDHCRPQGADDFVCD